MTAYTDIQSGSRVIASDRSNYWRYYGLHRDPFMPIVEDSNFFLPARWEQYFDLLQYLCESTNVLLSVTGAKGSGKTTFMRQFIAQIGDNAKICRLVGSTVLTAPQLSATLIKDFNLPKTTGETSEEQWESLCHNMQLGTQPYLLVIDDAHRLPQETLKVILNLIKQQSEHQMRLHVLLIGEMQLSSMLNALKESEADRELIHTILLEALNLQDTEAYIKHRLVAAGLPGAMPLRPADVARVYKLSEGVPGRINAVTRQVLIDIMQQRQLYGFAHFVRTRRTQFLGGAIILAVLLVLAFILTKGNSDPALRLYKLLFSQKTALPSTVAINAEATQISNNGNVLSTTETTKTLVMPTAIINKAETQNLAPAAVATQLPQTTINTSGNKTLKTPAINAVTTNTIGTAKSNNTNQWYAADMVEFKSSTAKQSATTTASHNTTPVAAALPVTAQITANSAPPAPTTATQQNVAANTKTAAAAMTGQINTTNAITDRLLTLDSPLLSNPKHFTLQLVGVGNEEAISKFISKNQLNESQVYYYHTNFRNKDWYVVIYGDYPTRQAAQAALSALPETVHNLHPWPRTLGSVAASIQHGQTNSTAGQTGMTGASTEITHKTAAAPKKNQGTAGKNTQDEGVNIPLIQ